VITSIIISTNPPPIVPYLSVRPYGLGGLCGGGGGGGGGTNPWGS
jgi:hypothetical protein